MLVSNAETGRALKTGFDTGNLHRPAGVLAVSQGRNNTRSHFSST
jgi:hypothetical protein